MKESKNVSQDSWKVLNKYVQLKLTGNFHINRRYSFSLHKMSKFKLRDVGVFVATCFGCFVFTFF